MTEQDRPKNENAIRILECGKYIETLLNADRYIARSEYSKQISDFSSDIEFFSVLKQSGMFDDFCKKNNLSPGRINGIMDSYGNIQELIDEQMEDMTRADIEKMVTDYYPGYESMLKKMDDDTLFEYIEKMIGEQIKEQYGIQMENMYSYLSDSTLAHDFGLLSLEDDDYLWLYENAMPPVYSTSTLKDNLKKLGYVDLDSPSKINIYASTFEDKDAIADAIERYNDSVSEDDKIEYTDIVALLMSSISTIINVISYVLIAFVAISLVVSSIMIGIITYISVLERTKEIGILRAIGASKRDVSRVFNAETFIIGLIAGLIGIGATLLLNIPINIIVHDLTGIYAINSTLPAVGGIALVLISVGLTFIAGLIPSGLAAKKDPVEALRTE